MYAILASRMTVFLTLLASLNRWAVSSGAGLFGSLSSARSDVTASIAGWILSLLNSNQSIGVSGMVVAVAWATFAMIEKNSSYVSSPWSCSATLWLKVCLSDSSEAIADQSVVPALTLCGAVLFHLVVLILISIWTAVWSDATPCLVVPQFEIRLNREVEALNASSI